LSSSTVRVLYLEDAFDHALLVKAFFNTLPGYEVTHAQDGDRAVELLKNEQWDLIVTDLNLPGRDGYAVIRTARQLSGAIPILVTTGYTQAQYEEQALRAGADQVMIKPLRQHEFVTRVVKMVEHQGNEEGEPNTREVILVIEGRLGDAEMGCGGVMMGAAQEAETVVVLPILNHADDASYEELQAARIACGILGIDLRLEVERFGDRVAQRDLIRRTVAELQPTSVFVPASGDRDESRREARLMTLQAATEVPRLYGYETATTGSTFVPTRFVDVHAQMVVKMEALAAYQSVGAPRVDLRPRMAQAYARYWGRWMDFTEVEAFEEVKRG